MSHSMVPPSAGSSAPANSQGGRNSQNPKYGGVNAHQAHGTVPHVPQHRQSHQPSQQQQLRSAGVPYNNFRVEMKQGQQSQVANPGAQPPPQHMPIMSYNVAPNSMVGPPLQLNPPQTQVRLPLTPGVFYQAPLPRPQQPYPQGRVQQMMPQYAAPFFNGTYSSGGPYFPQMPPQNMPQSMVAGHQQMPQQQPTATTTTTAPRQKKVLKIINPETNKEVDIKSSDGTSIKSAPPPMQGPPAMGPPLGVPQPMVAQHPGGAQVQPAPPMGMPQQVASPPHVPQPSIPPPNSFVSPTVQVPSPQENVLPKQVPQASHAPTDVPKTEPTTQPLLQQPQATENVVAPEEPVEAEVEAKSRSARDDESEERRKVEERNVENLRKTQQATQNNSRKETTVLSEGSVATKDEQPSKTGASSAQAVPPTVNQTEVASKEMKVDRKEFENAQNEPTNEERVVAKNATTVAAVENMSNESKVQAGDGDVAPSPQGEAKPEDDLEDGEIVSDNGSETDESSSNVMNDDYKPGHWSPLHPEGKKQYDRAFLLKLQYRPMSKTPPMDMAKIEIFREISNSHTLSDSPGQARPPVYNDNNRNYNRNTGGSLQGRRPFPRPNDNRPRRVITLSTSINQDVKLHVAETAWKREKDAADADEAIYKQFRSILNKLAPQHFVKLSNQIKAMQINTEDRLSHVISLVMEKALNETHFSSLYAKLCHVMLSELTVTKSGTDGAPTHTVTFRKLLLQKCQQEFEKDTDDSEASKKREKELQEERQKKLDATQSEQEKKELMEFFDEQDTKMKRRTLGLMRFIGELYNLTILSFPVMHDCFSKLMKNPTDVDSIECACNLFRTIGKKFADDANANSKGGEAAKFKEKYNKLMEKLKKIISENREAQRLGNTHLPQRVIFMLEDVWELRQRNWVPRRDEQAPKTLQQIQQEADQEKILANAAFTGGSGGSQGGNGGGGNRYNSMQSGDRGRRQFTSQSQSAVPNNYKQVKQMLGSVNLSNMSLSASLGPVPLGPNSRTGQGWVTGASGGGSRNSSLRGINRADVDGSLNINSVNKFAPLDGNEITRSQENSPSRRDAENRRRDLTTQSDTMARGSAPSSRTPSQSGASGGETHPLQGKNDDEQTVRLYAQTILSEFTSSENPESFLRDFCERAHQQNVNRFVSLFIELGCESPKKYKYAAEAITELHKQRIVSTRQIEVILKEQLELAEDMVIDIPKYYTYMAEIVAKFILNELSETFDFRSIIKCVCEGLESDVALKLLIPLFAYINSRSKDGVAKLWEKSGLTIRGLIPNLNDEQVKTLEEALGTSGQSGSGLGLSLKELISRFTAALEKEGSERDKLLEDAIHQAGTDRKNAVRACALVFLSRGRNGESFDKDLLKLDEIPKPIKELFTKDVTIHALNALQSYMLDNVYPKDVASKFCNWIYDSELVEEDLFIDWAENKAANQEPHGYAITLKTLEGFIEWLKNDDSPAS